MAKSKTPFLSMGSSGSIGNAITTQKRGSETLIRAKPRPTYRKSLPQMYNRWLYEDYAYLWTQQSEATRAEYRTAGVRFHLTGFQYWMKYQLTHLPNIAGWWKLDTQIDGLAFDSGKKGNHATIFGATLEAGVIGNAYGFDGLNNWLHAPANPSTQPTTEFTVTMLFKAPDVTIQAFLFNNHYRGATKSGLAFFINASAMRLAVGNGTAQPAIQSATPIVNDTWHAVGARLLNDKLEIFIDDIKDPNSIAFTPPIYYDPARQFQICAERAITFSEAVMDNITFYNEGLSDELILNILSRRYP